MVNYFKSMWRTEEFWVAIVTAILVILNDGLNLGIDPAVVWPVVLLIFGWIFTSGVVKFAFVVRSAIVESAKVLKK